MNHVHDFGSPRNLYEKLHRDNEKLDKEINGDNLFNFISTAFHLQHWIKNSPLISSEVMKRMLKRLGRDKNFLHCRDIARAKEHFRVKVEHTGKAIMFVGKEEINVDDFRNEIVSLYETYFKQK
jgi:hypothetical protein